MLDAAPETGPALPFCKGLSPSAALCDDFDDGELGAGWDSVVAAGAAEATLDATLARSKPRSLRMTSAAVDTGEISNVLLRKSFTGAPRTASLTFAANPGALPSLGVVGIATLDLSTSHLLTLYLRDDDPSKPKASVVEARSDGKSVRYAFDATLPTDRWTTVSLEVDVTAGTLAVKYDAKIVLTTDQLEKKTANGPTIRIGALVTGPAEAFRVSFDDVIFRQSP